jgi:pimeloyl-ACP methyl ester carboxylesterase
MSIVPTDHFVVAQGLRMHYRRWSPTAKKHERELVLVHGLASATPIWNLVAPLLAEQGYVVTALDQRGHGESEKPDIGYDFSTIVADDDALLRALSIERPVLIGHSWGASVVLQYAVTHPENVAALILVDGATGQASLRSGRSREQFLQELAPPRFAGTPVKMFLAYIQKGPLGRQWSPELEDSMLHIVQVRDDDTVGPRLSFENHMQILNAMWDHPTFDLYPQVACPITLIVADSEADTGPQAAYRARRDEDLIHIQALRPDLALVRMPNTIHDLPFQRPQRLAEEILQTVSHVGS